MNLIAGHLLCALGLHDEETCFWILRHFSEVSAAMIAITAF
eukprot:SAG31_NODE_1931_length_6880_cov_6.530010_3_plen_41_part_00